MPLILNSNDFKSLPTHNLLDFQFNNYRAVEALRWHFD